MVNENGTWVMYGVDRDDPECIHTVEEAMRGIYPIATALQVKKVLGVK